jgi:hypothetical protein
VGAGALWLPPSFGERGQIHGSAQRNPASILRAKKRFAGDPGVGRVYYGSVISPERSIESFESAVGHRLGTHRNYHQASQVRQLIARARSDVAARRFSVLSIKPPGSWRSVAEGQHNGWLDEILEGLAAIDAPMAFTIHHEPEDDADDGDNAPEWHKRMTELAYARAAHRAPRVHVIQILMQYTFRNGNGRNPRHWLAPSVDLFGLDAYNYWVPRGSVEWISFKRMVSRAQEWADGKPVVIGEYGVHTDPSRPGRGAKWMRKAFKYARKHDVVAMNYFNVAPRGVSAPFTLDAERLAAFKRCLKDERTVRLKYKH